MFNFTDCPSPEIALGKRLHLAREIAGFTQGEAAQSLGITSSALSQYEKGKRRINALTLDKIARLYGVGVNYFFTNVNNSTQMKELPQGYFILNNCLSVLRPKEANLCA